MGSECRSLCKCTLTKFKMYYIIYYIQNRYPHLLKFYLSFMCCIYITLHCHSISIESSSNQIYTNNMRYSYLDMGFLGYYFKSDYLFRFCRPEKCNGHEKQAMYFIEYQLQAIRFFFFVCYSTHDHDINVYTYGQKIASQTA